MKSTITWKHLLLCLAITAVAACGSDDTEDTGGQDNDPSTPACTEQASMCATIHVPDDYDGTPRQLTVGLFETSTVAGPPSDVPALIDGPSITVAEPFELNAEDIAAEGDYYIFFALYNEGGGTFVPVAGVNHTWMSDSPIAFNGEPINLGDVFLEIAE